MRIQASAGRNRKKSVADWVYKMTLTAETPEEHKLLAEVLKSFADGKRIVLHDGVLVNR